MKTYQISLLFSLSDILQAYCAISNLSNMVRSWKQVKLLHSQTFLLLFRLFTIKNKDCSSRSYLIVLNIILIIYDICWSSIPAELICIKIWHHHLKLLQKISIKRKALEYIMSGYTRLLSLEIILVTTILSWSSFLSLNILRYRLKLISLARPLFISSIPILILRISLLSLVAISIIC